MERLPDGGPFFFVSVAGGSPCTVSADNGRWIGFLGGPASIRRPSRSIKKSRGQTMPDFTTLDALVRQTAISAPSRVAVIDGDRQLDYAGLDDLINRVAASLQAEGLVARDAISICALSSLEYVAVFLGALRAGVAVAPLAPSSTPHDFAAMVKDAGAKTLFMDEVTAAAMGAAA